MDVDSGQSDPFDWLLSTNVDLDVALSYRLQSCPRIECGLDERRIAMDGAHSEEVDARIVAGEEQGIRIL
jgi:hypothetical protein